MSSGNPKFEDDLFTMMTHISNQLDKLDSKLKIIVWVILLPFVMAFFAILLR